MKNSILYISLALILIIAGSGYIFYTPPDKSILGRALVLIFVNDDIDGVKLANQWEKLDLSVEIINTCASGNNAKRIACKTKYMQRALSRTKNVNKPLLLLADKDSSQTLLLSLSDHESNQIAALILLQAKANGNHIDRIIAPKTLVISDADDLAENVFATRLLASSIRNNDQWVWSTMLVDDGNGLLSHPVLPHMVSYLINGKINPAYQIEFNAESRWQNPIVNNNKFFEIKRVGR